MGNELIIKVCNDRIYFNPRLSIPIQQTNIPKKHLTFRFHQDFFWKVEMLGYNSSDKCLKVKVAEYGTSEISKFDQQQPKKDVKQLLFEKFDWEKLEPLLTSYQKIKLREILFNIDASHFSRGDVLTTTASKPELTIAELQPRVVKSTEDFWIDFTDAHFMLGYVTFKKYIKKLGKELDFKIPNEHILAEFENIKFWFARKLKTKKFKVSVFITLKDDQLTEVLATSKHIDQITPEFIDSVKYQRTFALTKEPRFGNPDKSLFTADEIFSEIDTDDLEGNVFNQSEEDILNFFLEKSDIRNKKQLAYLAGKKQSENHKLRYTLAPNFGFLFLVEGLENNHFVWELLNSHATYVWSIDKQQREIDLQFKRIESIVNTVRTSGRENYKRAYRNNHQDNDLVFRVINHEHVASDLVDAFPKWKSKLNEQLT